MNTQVSLQHCMVKRTIVSMWCMGSLSAYLAASVACNEDSSVGADEVPTPSDIVSADIADNSSGDVHEADSDSDSVDDSDGRLDSRPLALPDVRLVDGLCPGPVPDALDLCQWMGGADVFGVGRIVEMEGMFFPPGWDVETAWCEGEGNVYPALRVVLEQAEPGGRWPDDGRVDLWFGHRVLVHWYPAPRFSADGDVSWRARSGEPTATEQALALGNEIGFVAYALDDSSAFATLGDPLFAGAHGTWASSAELQIQEPFHACLPNLSPESIEGEPGDILERMLGCGDVYDTGRGPLRSNVERTRELAWPHCVPIHDDPEFGDDRLPESP